MINDNLDAVIRSQDLRDISIDIVESLIDDAIAEDAIKEIPILKTIVAIKKIKSSISDAIYLKKAMRVLNEIKDVSQDDRKEFIDSLDDEYDKGIDKIMMAIDKIDSTKKSLVFGRLCRLRAEKQIDKEEFFRLTKVIQDAYLGELELILSFKDVKEQEEREKGYSFFTEAEYYPLLSLGLIYQYQSEQEEIRLQTPRNEYEEEITGGKIYSGLAFTDLGDLLRKHYATLFPDNTTTD